MLRFRLMGVIGLALVLLAFPVDLMASDEEHKPADEHHAEAAEHEAHSGGHHVRDFNHEVAIFLGGTDEEGHSTQFTWGLDYKRRVGKAVAVGLIVDYAGGDLRNLILAPSVSYWPGLGNLQLIGAAGVEFHDGRDDGDMVKADEGHHEDSDHTYFLVRLGLGYDFHLPKGFGIVPNINADFVDDKVVWVWGLNFTYGF